MQAQFTNRTSAITNQSFAKLLVITFALILFSGVAMAEKINLNTGNSEALQYISGIGPSKATQIIATRESKGKFETIDQLIDVPGIGQKLLESIRKYGVLEGGVSVLTEEMKSNSPGS